MYLYVFDSSRSVCFPNPHPRAQFRRIGGRRHGAVPTDRASDEALSGRAESASGAVTGQSDESKIITNMTDGTANYDVKSLVRFRQPKHATHKMNPLFSHVLPASQTRMDLLRQTGGFFLRVALRAQNLRLIFRCKTGASLAAIHHTTAAAGGNGIGSGSGGGGSGGMGMSGGGGASSHAFAASALISNAEMLEATMTRAPLEQKEVKPVNLRCVGFANAVQ